jgi:PKHD-type hydroxylase
MPIVLTDLFTTAEVAALQRAVADLEFEDGRRTAGRTASAVKDNEQAAATPEHAAVLEKVRTTFSAHPLFEAVAYPKNAVTMMATRTTGGGRYGDHVDNALMAGGRTDISFTLFLSEPGSYDGGELVITDRLEDRRIKLAPGRAVVYPSNTLHRVEPVTSGERLVVIGWWTSWVRDPARREILFDLWRAINLAETAGSGALVQLLSKSRSNLLRQWAE